MNNKMANSYSLSHNVTLMENIYHGKPVEYTNKMFTVKDANNDVLVFTQDNYGNLILLQKSQNNTGYLETYLDKDLPQGSKIIHMAVAEGGFAGSVVVAVVVEKDGIPSIWHTTLSIEQLNKIKKDKIKTSSDHTWIDTELPDLSGQIIYQIIVGTSKNNKIEVVFTTARSFWVDYATGVFMLESNKKNNKEQFTRISLPYVITNILDIKFGRNEELEQVENIHGLLFIMYKVNPEGASSFMIYKTYPSVDTFTVPVDLDSTTFSLAERNGSSEIFVASKNQLYLYESGDWYKNAINIGEVDGTIKEIHPTYNEPKKKLECFVLLDAKEGQKGSEVYNLREDDAVTNKWTQPIFHHKNVLLMTVGHQGKDGAKEVYLYEHADKDQIVFERQGDTENDSLWHEDIISVEQQDRPLTYDHKAYMINVKLHDKPDSEELLEYSKEELKIKCSQNVMIKVNNESIHTDNHTIIGKFNGEGICKIEVPATSIDSPLINISSERVPDILRIDPTIHVQDEMDKLTQSEDSLKNARLKKRDGSAGDLLVPESSHDNVGAVYNAIKELKTVRQENGMTLLLSPQLSTSKSMDDFCNTIDSSDFERVCLEFNDNTKGGRTVTYKTLSDEDMAQLYSQKDAAPNNWAIDLIGNVINFLKKGIEKVTRIIVEAVDNGLKLIIEIGNFIWEGIIETLEQVWTFIVTILEEVLNIASSIVMSFFSFLFPWDEIKRTQLATKGIITLAYRKMMNELDSITDEGKIKKAFKDLSDKLFEVEDITKKLEDGLGDEGKKSIGSISEEHNEQHDEYMNSPQVKWSQNLLMDQISPIDEQNSKLQVPAFNIKEDLIDKIIKALEKFANSTMEEVSENFEKLIKKIKEDPKMTIFDIIGDVLTTVEKTLLTVTGIAFQAIFDIAKAVIEEAWNIINTDIELGWLSQVYKSVTGNSEFTILNIMCFVVAVPTVIVTKMIDPKARDVMPKLQVDIIEKHVQDQSSSLEAMMHESVDRTEEEDLIFLTNTASILSLIVKSIVDVMVFVHTSFGYSARLNPELKKLFGRINFCSSLANSTLSLFVAVINVSINPNAFFTIKLSSVFMYRIAGSLLGAFYLTAAEISNEIGSRTITVLTGYALAFLGFVKIIGGVIQFIYQPRDDKIKSELDHVLKLIQNIARGVRSMALASAKSLVALTPKPPPPPSLETIETFIVLTAIYGLAGLAGLALFGTRIIYKLIEAEAAADM